MIQGVKKKSFQQIKRCTVQYNVYTKEKRPLEPEVILGIAPPQKKKKLDLMGQAYNTG